MAKGRPGGNPGLKKYQFKQKYNRDESCTSKMGLRLPPSLHEELKKIPNWHEKVREAIAEIVENHLANATDEP